MQVLFEFFGGLVHLLVLPADVTLEVDTVGDGGGYEISSHAVNCIYR